MDFVLIINTGTTGKRMIWRRRWRERSLVFRCTRFEEFMGHPGEGYSREMEI